MSISTTQSAGATRNLTWQPTQGIVFGTSPATQEELYSTNKSNKQIAKGARDTIKKSALSTTASQSPEISNRALPLLPYRPASRPLQNHSMRYETSVEGHGGIVKQEERRQTRGVEGQTENGGSIIFEDGSGSDAENPVESVATSPDQKRATKMARLEEDKVQIIDRNLKMLEAMKKKADKISRTLESKKRIQKMVDEYETTKRKADEEARNVKALQKAKKETDEAKRRSVEAELKAKKETDEAEVALWLECKRIRQSSRSQDAPPPVPEVVDRIEKRMFYKIHKGFRVIIGSALQLAAATWCSRRVRLTCEDINDAVDMWKMELTRIGHQYRLAYRLNQDLIRYSQMSGAEQVLNRRASNRQIRLYYMMEPFKEYATLSREIRASFDMLAAFWLRWRGRMSRTRVEAWRKLLDQGNIKWSITDYFEIVWTRIDASYGITPWEKRLWKLGNSMAKTGHAMSNVFHFWKKGGLLPTMQITHRRLRQRTLEQITHRRLRQRTLEQITHRRLRQRMLDMRRVMLDDEEEMHTLLRECSLIGARLTENSMIAPNHPVRIPDSEQKDAVEADVGLSTQTLSRSGTLNISPTSKRGSLCSAMGSPSSDINAQVDMVDYTSMVYQIPEEVMREAMLASSSTGAAYWQYSLYQEGGDLSGDKVKVHYCTSKETTERIAQLFLDKEVIGFDIEWKPQAQIGEGIKKNVSLIQLASEERIALFHVARYGKGDTIDDLLAPSLKKIMESPEISKVGVSVKADCTRLRRFLGVEACGLFELSHLYKLIKHSAGDVKKINKMLVSLAQQVEEHLQLPMWKGDVRSSDWSQKLNYEQIKYAASDSYAGLRLYDVMESKRKTLEPTPPRPAHAELNLPIILANGKTVATYDEPDELKDEKPTADITAHPADLEEMARDFLDIELEDSEIKPSTTSKSAARGSKKSPEITEAETWITNWRSKLPPGYKARAMPSQLRAYAIWSELGKEVAEVAAILRDPPLQMTTVANYILEAIRLERVPFQEHRLEKVWELLPARAPGRARRPQGGK